MKSVSKFLLGGAVISVFFAAGAMAEGSIYTRSADAAHADLVRDWNGPAKADIASQEKRALHSRTAEQAYDDLVRNWGG